MDNLEWDVILSCVSTCKAIYGKEFPQVEENEEQGRVNSKTHGSIDLYDVTPLRNCSEGLRKIVMVTEFALAPDVVPVSNFMIVLGR